MEIGVFIPIDNNGWLISETAPQYMPTFELHKLIVTKAEQYRTVMPWLIASQTIPVLAIAPMVVVVLGNAGLTRLAPKALIAEWLSFLPVAVAMTVGLRAPDPMQRDLMRTYAPRRRRCSPGCAGPRRCRSCSRR